MQGVVLTLASVSLAAALGSFVKRVQWLAWILLAVAGALFGYFMWSELASNPVARPIAASAEARDGNWLKLRAAAGSHLPAQWNLTVSSFSGQWEAEVSKPLLEKRDRTSSAQEVVAKFPQDFRTVEGRPTSGRYEAIWTTKVVGEDGSIEADVIARVEFRYD